MDFKLSRSQKEIQKAAREFAKGLVDKDLALEMDKQSVFPKDLHEKAAELGFIGVHFDEKYLGSGLGFLENTLIAEELCCRDATIGSALMLAGFGAECVHRYGSDRLKEDFLPLVADGKMLASAAIPEAIPGNGSAPATITARKEGKSWVINGEINRAINGGSSGFYCLLCGSESPAVSQKEFNMILVEGDRDGISTIDADATIGLRMTAFADLCFENVRVPLDNLIGKEGDGLKQLLFFINESRVLMASLALGIGQGALNRTIDYVKQREQFGKKIVQFQITRQKLAEMALSIELARSLTYQAAWQLNQPKSDSRLTAMAKLAATRAALDITHEAIQLHGGYGYTAEYEVERFCRDAKTLTMLGGSTAAAKEGIAAGIIGKIKP